MATATVHLTEALRGLSSYPLRAALTALGIVIGVAAVITVLAIGEGARRRVIEQIQSLGGNLLLVTPGSARPGAVQLGAGPEARHPMAVSHRGPDAQFGGRVDRCDCRCRRLLAVRRNK